jgi:hypothetical protein
MARKLVDSPILLNQLINCRAYHQQLHNGRPGLQLALRPTLPTIKSEPAGSPQSGSALMKVEEGVPLFGDPNNDKTRTSTPANSKGGSPCKLSPAHKE